MLGSANPLRSRYMNGGAPTNCAYCKEPFTDHAWRGSDNRYYCNEFCEEGGADGKPMPPVH